MILVLVIHVDSSYLTTRNAVVPDGRAAARQLDSLVSNAVVRMRAEYEVGNLSKQEWKI